MASLHVATASLQESCQEHAAQASCLKQRVADFLLNCRFMSQELRRFFAQGLF